MPSSKRVKRSEGRVDGGTSSRNCWSYKETGQTDDAVGGRAARTAHFRPKSAGISPHDLVSHFSSGFFQSVCCANQVSARAITS